MKLARLTVLALTFVLTAQFAAAKIELDGTWEAVVTIYGQRGTMVWQDVNFGGTLTYRRSE